MDINYEFKKSAKCHHSVISRIINLKDQFLTSSSDKAIKLWDKNTFNCLKTFQEHHDQVSDICMLKIDSFASASHDKTIRVWNFYHDKSIRTLSGHEDKVNCLKLLPNGLLVSGSSDGCIKVWNLESGECIKTLKEHTKRVVGFDLGQKDQLFSASNDGTIKLFDTNNWTILNSFPINENITCIKVLDENQIAFGSNNCIKIWSIKNNELIRKIEIHHAPITCIEVLDNRDWAVSCAVDKTMNIWVKNSGVSIFAFHDNDAPITRVDTSVQNEILCGTSEGGVRLYNRKFFDNSSRPDWL